MLLGQLIRDLSDEGEAAEALRGLGDLPLLARVEQAAQAQDMGAGAYAALAVMRFADQAGDDDWLALMTALERADDPGVACLRAMVVWALGQDKASPCKHAAGAAQKRQAGG